MLLTMDELRFRFKRACSVVEELRDEYEEAVMRRYERALREMEEIIPELRRLAWEESQRNREAWLQEKRELEEDVAAAKELLVRKENELKLAKAEGRTEEVKKLAGEVEDVKARLAQLNERYRAVLGREINYRPDAEFVGTLGELKLALLRPDFLLSRQWAKALLKGPWRWALEDQPIRVKFSLETGEPIEWWPKEPTHLPWRRWP